MAAISDRLINEQAESRRAMRRIQGEGVHVSIVSELQCNLADSRQSVCIVDGTGYTGRHVVPLLLARGHPVTALVRERSARHVPAGTAVIAGDPLRMECYAHVQLVGVPHPSPWKAKQFCAVDRTACAAEITAAKPIGIRHFILVSVAHPAPVIQACIDVRMECEALKLARAIPATILRPWYVIGPVHYWPLAFKLLYAWWERRPATRAHASRLGLLTLPQMLNALCWAVEYPADGVRLPAARPV
jgi:hypothetical protein